MSLNNLSVKVITGFLLLLFAQVSRAGGPELKNINWQDSIYVKSYRSRPHLTFEFARRRQLIDIRNPNLDTLLFRYEPNTRTNFITAFDYRWLSVSLGLVSFPTTAGNRKGESSQFSLRASFNGKRIWNTNFIQYYSGFYLTNPASVQPDWNVATDTFPQRPDVNTTTIFSNAYYCFKPEKFSYRAALWQLDRQERSAGSFLAGLSMRIFALNSDSMVTLIPPQALSLFDPQYRIIAQRTTNFSLNVGYVHTFVYNRSWFLTLYFVPGLSLQSSYYLSDDQVIRADRSQFTGSSEFRIIMGYNGEKWFAGLSSYSISFSGNRKLGVWIDNSYTWFRLFAGFRLNPPNPNRKAKLLDRIGL